MTRLTFWRALRWPLTFYPRWTRLELWLIDRAVSAQKRELFGREDSRT